MRVLVTGADGFVGRNLVAMLTREKDEHGDRYEVSTSDIRHINPIYDGVTGADLAKEDVGVRVVTNREVDVVVHLASSVSTPGSIEHPLETFRNTVRTAAHVLEGCRLANVPCILTSSVKARDGMTPYGASKRMAETWALEYMACYGLPVIINRPGTIYGPGQEGSPESGWIAWFLKARQENLKVVINGDGSQVRDLLHVSDYCRLLVKQINSVYSYAGSHIWDVGGGPRNAVTVMQMVDHLGLAHSFGPRRYGDADAYVGVNDVFDWKPTIDWRDALGA